MCHLTPGIGEPRPIDSQLLLPSNRLALPEEDAGPVHDGAEHIEVIALISRSIERYSFPVGNRWPGSVRGCMESRHTRHPSLNHDTHTDRR